MSDDTDMHGRHREVLRKLQAQGEALADLLFGRAQAAAEAGEAEAAKVFAGAWHRVARSLRQSLALEAMLARAEARDAREAVERAELEAAVAEGKVKPHHRVGSRLVWHEGETQQETWAAFLDRIANQDAEHLAADPAARVAWLEEREAQIRDDLARARAALAESQGAPRGLSPPDDPNRPGDGLAPDSS